MKLCNQCKSDLVTVESHVGLKVFLVIILLFIPFGIFFVWAPFLISPTVSCKLCGSQDIREMDWREFEEKKALLTSESTDAPPQPQPPPSPYTFN